LFGFKLGRVVYYGVKGVEEFYMMVNNNYFLNYMAKKSMEFTLEVVNEMKTSAPGQLKDVEDKRIFILY
jgi:maltose phosphorylase